MNITRKQGALLLVAAVATVSVLAFFVPTMNATIQINDPTTLNTPFILEEQGFDVHDGVSDQFIRSVAPSRQFTDPTFKYPKVDVFYSQPFFVSPSGAFAETAPAEYLQTVGTVVVDGTVYFVHKFMYGLDIGIRTSTNLNLSSDTTSYLSPLWETYHYYNGFGYTFPLDGTITSSGGTRPVNTVGKLAGHINTGTNPWTITIEGNAKITSSLVKIDYRINSNPPVGTNTMTYDRAINHLSTSQGNSKVYVYPKFGLKAKPQFITTPYQFNTTLGGETTVVTVTPAGSNAGFEDIYKLQEYDRKGAIPNTLENDLSSARLRVIVPSSNAVVDANAPNSPVTDSTRTTTANYIATETLTGGVELDGDPTVQTVTGGSDPIGTITDNLVLPAAAITVVDASTPSAFLNYQSQVNVSAGAWLQPITTIYTQKMNVYWDFRFWSGLPFIGYTTPMSGEESISVPYQLRVQNTYAVQRVIISTMVMTTATLTMATASGVPIDPNTFTDYQLNSIIKDPSNDIIKVDVEREYFDWDTFWGDVGGILGGVGIFGGGTLLVILVVVAVLYTTGKLGGIVSFFKNLRGDHAAARSRKREFSFSIGKEGMQISEKRE